MRNSSMSQRSSRENTFDLMSLLSDVDTTTVDLIGQQQREQIDALKVQVKSLENELTSRNEESLFIKKRVSQTCITINQIIESLSSTISPEEKEKKSFLKKINNEKNHYDKIDQYISFMHNYTKSNSESFNRICDQLRSYVQLIEMLGSDSKFPFEISSQSNIQQVFFQEAQKTNEFLKDQSKNNFSQDFSIPPITEILKIKDFSPESRLEKIQAFLCGVDIPIEELKNLFLQEIAITDILRKYIYTNLSEQKSKDDMRQEIEKEIRNQIEDDIRSELTNSLTEKIKIETENELKPKIEQELRFVINSEQQHNFDLLKDQYEKSIHELKSEIERLKISAKDDLINEISSKSDTQLRRNIVSLLREEIEADIKSQLQKEKSLNPKNDNEYSFNQYDNDNNSGSFRSQNSSQQILNDQQNQYIQNKLKKALKRKEKQLRAEFDLELQKKESELRSEYDGQLQQKEIQIKNLQTQYNLELQQKEIQIKNLQTQYNLELQQKEKQNKSKIQSISNYDLQQKEAQIRKQLQDEYDLELQSKESFIRTQLQSKYDLELQQKEIQIRNKINSEYDVKLQKRESQIRNQLQSELRQKENQIKDQLRAEYDLEYQQKLAQIKSQPQTKSNLELQQKENQIKAQLRSEFDLEMQRKEIQIKKQLRSEFDSELQQKENKIKKQLRSEFDLELQEKEIQIKNKLRSEFESELRQREKQIQNQLQSKHNFDLQQQEVQITSKLRSEFEMELQQKESQIRSQLEPEIKAQILSQISQNSEKSYKFNHNSKLNSSYSNDQENYHDKNLEDVYVLLCDACGVSPKSFKFNGNKDSIDFRSNPILVAIIDHASSLASDVSEIRSYITSKQNITSFNLLSHFKIQEEQVAHLDQLHTQTRALLVRQSQMISDLRSKSDYASWVKWARNLYKILDPNNSGHTQERTSLIFNINNSPESIDELKTAIEEKAASLIAHEKASVIKRKT